MELESRRERLVRGACLPAALLCTRPSALLPALLAAACQLQVPLCLLLRFVIALPALASALLPALKAAGSRTSAAGSHRGRQHSRKPELQDPSGFTCQVQKSFLPSHRGTPLLLQVGDCLLTSSFLSYTGAFTYTYRHAMVRFCVFLPPDLNPSCVLFYLEAITHSCRHATATASRDSRF
jgi:hypothetical protein